jgi:hypothetical protein
MYVNGPVVVVGIDIDIGIGAGVGEKVKEEQECEQDRSRTETEPGYLYRIGSVVGQDWLNGLRCTYLVCRGNKLHIEDGDYAWRRIVLPETFTTGGLFVTRHHSLALGHDSPDCRTPPPHTSREIRR